MKQVVATITVILWDVITCILEKKYKLKGFLEILSTSNEVAVSTLNSVRKTLRVTKSHKTIIAGLIIIHWRTFGKLDKHCPILLHLMFSCKFSILDV